MYALRVFKRETGVSLLKDGVKDFDEETMINLVYAGLLGADREMGLTSDEVADKIDFVIFKQTMTQLSHDMSKLTGTDGKK
jgi:hypothetical protein